MDMNESNEFGMEKSHGDGMPAAEWQHFNAPAISVMPANTSIAGVIGATLTSSPYLSAPMVEVLAAAGHCNQSLHGESSIPSTASAAISSSSISIGKPVALSPRAMMLSTLPGIFPAGLPHFPADSAFVQRAARFSCFGGGGGGGGGSFGGANLFPPSQSMAPSSNACKDGMAAQAQKNELHQSEGKAGSLDRSPINNQRDERSEDGQDGNTDSTDVAGNSSPSDLFANKRRKTIRDIEKDQVHRGVQSSSETKKETAESKRKVEQNSSKNTGKDGKDNSAAAKEGYVHVRARRGQATNSHSLAERVRREKISERMKYLQELVPGCSKVTGKAVMLDEIINYVQSLQRQVEFLSMKLAAVNPQLDFSIEGLLAKNILHSHGGSSSGIGFSQEMIYPQAYPPHQGLVQPGISAMANSPDTFRRAINSQLATSGYKEASLQMQNPWSEDLLTQMAYGSNPPVNTREKDNKSDGFAI